MLTGTLYVAPLPVSLKEYFVVVVSFGSTWQRFRQDMCAECSSPRPRVNEYSFARLVAVPVPHNLQDNVEVVSLAPHTSCRTNRGCASASDFEKDRALVRVVLREENVCTCGSPRSTSCRASCLLRQYLWI